MYKFASKQIKFEDFGQPVGLHINPENRWIKRAESIPWDEIEHRYAELFKNKKGNVAKPLRLALGTCIIQAEYGLWEMMDMGRSQPKFTEAEINEIQECLKKKTNYESEIGHGKY